MPIIIKQFLIKFDMEFIEDPDRENTYDGCSFKASDLYAYAEALEAAGISVSSANKRELVTDIVTFSRYENTLAYKITFTPAVS